MKCRHANHYDVGMTGWQGFSAFVMWCPDCGAIRRVQESGAYKVQRWQIPKQANERKDD